MIPKNEMVDGKWYRGICRNAYMAQWDYKKQEFVYIRFKFDFMMDRIQHFEDAKDGQDGFIPVEWVERLGWEKENEIKKEVGY